MKFLFNNQPGNFLNQRNPSGRVFIQQEELPQAESGSENKEIGSKIGVEGIMHHAAPMASVAVNLLEGIEDFRRSFSDDRVMNVNNVNVKAWLNPSENYKPG